MVKRNKRNTLRNLKIDRRMPIVALPVSYNPDDPKFGIKLVQQTYEIVDPDSGIAVAVHVPLEILSKLSAAKALLFFGFENPRLPDIPKSTWPETWKYLSLIQLDQLQEFGLPVKSQSHILIECLHIDSFGATLFYPKGIQTFFDSFVEIIWQEYVVETELRRYRTLKKKGQPTTVTIDQVNEINLQNADTWIPLENCVVRIRSMWERIHKTLIPIYFSGNEAPETTSGTYWQDLDSQIRKLLNKDQLPFYEKLHQATVEIQKSLLKDMRDSLIHKLSHRPIGVLPAKSGSASNLPNTVDDLYQLVMTERSRFREALILMTAIMRYKTPLNKEITAM